MSAQLAPAARRVDVDLDHAGIGRDLRAAAGADRAAARSPRARPACASSAAVASIAREQVDVVLEMRERRQEDVEAAVARLDAQRGARVRVRSPRARRAAAALRSPIVPRDAVGPPSPSPPAPARRRPRVVGCGAPAAGGARRRAAARREVDRASKSSARAASSGDPGQRVERQAVAHRRVAGNEVHARAAELQRLLHQRAAVDGSAPSAAAARSRSPCRGRGAATSARRRRSSGSSRSVCSGSTLTGSVPSFHR